MTAPHPPETVELTPDGAAALLRDELALATRAQARGDLDAALDAMVRAMGLALQLGPAPCEQALVALLDHARRMSHSTLATLGPALVQLDGQVREAGALPDTPVMESWATLVAHTGMLMGIVGVAGALPAAERQAMVSKVLAVAAALDDQTGNLFNYAAWVDAVVAG